METIAIILFGVGCFALGMIIFAILTNSYLGEGITTKVAVSLILATALVVIQIFWK